MTLGVSCRSVAPVLATLLIAATPALAKPGSPCVMVEVSFLQVKQDFLQCVGVEMAAAGALSELGPPIDRGEAPLDIETRLAAGQGMTPPVGSEPYRAPAGRFWQLAIQGDIEATARGAAPGFPIYLGEFYVSDSARSLTLALVFEDFELEAILRAVERAQERTRKTAESGRSGEGSASSAAGVEGGGATSARADASSVSPPTAAPGSGRQGGPGAPGPSGSYEVESLGSGLEGLTLSELDGERLLRVLEFEGVTNAWVIRPAGRSAGRVGLLSGAERESELRTPSILSFEVESVIETSYE